MVAVITRRWVGPIAPAASSAAVAGNTAGSASPVSDRRGVSNAAWSARVLASPFDRFSTRTASGPSYRTR